MADEFEQQQEEYNPDDYNEDVGGEQPEGEQPEGEQEAEQQEQQPARQSAQPRAEAQQQERQPQGQFQPQTRQLFTPEEDARLQQMLLDPATMVQANAEIAHRVQQMNEINRADADFMTAADTRGRLQAQMRRTLAMVPPNIQITPEVTAYARKQAYGQVLANSDDPVQAMRDLLAMEDGGKQPAAPPLTPKQQAAARAARADDGTFAERQVIPPSQRGAPAGSVTPQRGGATRPAPVRSNGTPTDDAMEALLGRYGETPGSIRAPRGR